MTTPLRRTRRPSVLNVAVVIRDGGGTPRAELTVADKLRERGHEVTVFGPPEVRAETEAAAFDLQQLDWATSAARAPEDLMPRMIAAAVPWARHLTPVFEDGYDVVVADCTAFGALMAAQMSGVPSVGLMPTVYVAAAPTRQTEEVRAAWRRALSGINRARTAVGLRLVFSVTEQILEPDRLLVLTSRAFELAEIQPPAHVRYVGPQLPRASDTAHQIPAGESPLILVSLGTSEQGQRPVIERVIAAVSALPVRALVTVGPRIDPATIEAPPQVMVEQFVPHDAVLPYADLVVTHAGHGTVLAAVTAGVPVVCLPMGRDQRAVALRATRHGVGFSVDPQTDVDALRAAITQVLGDPSYRTAARRLAAKTEPAGCVVAEIEAVAESEATAPMEAHEENELSAETGRRRARSRRVAQPSPTRWKLWLLIVCCLYPVITAAVTAAAPVLEPLPTYVRFAIIVPIMVAFMLWILIPALHRLFGRWLTA